MRYQAGQTDMLNNEPNNRMQLTGPAFWFFEV